MVIPLYNKKKIIQKTLSSVCSQTYENFDIIVVDDGSTDGSAKHLSFEKFDNLKVIHQENLGQSAARNKGIKNATGDYIAFLDADDLWKPDHLQNLANLARELPSAGIYASAYISKFPRGFSTITSFPISDSRLINSYEYFEAASDAPVVWVSATMVPKKIFEEVGLFLEGEHRGADREMWGRILLKYNLAYNSQPTAIYCNDIAGQETRKKRPIQFPPMIKTIDCEIKKISDEQLRSSLLKYRQKLLNGHLGKALKDGSKDEILHVLSLQQDNSIFGRIMKSLFFLSGLCSVNLARFFYRLCGHRYILFFLHKKYIQSVSKTSNY